MTLDRRSFLQAVVLGTVASAVTTSSAEDREKLEGAKLNELFAEISKARRTVKSLRANFTQERKLTLLATSVKSSGQLLFAAPDRLRWELGPPDDVIYWVGPEGLSYRTKSTKATASPSTTNVARALSDVRALLAGDISALGERYVLAGARGASDVEVSGTAKDKNASVRAFTLVLDKSLVLPMRARLLEGKSDAIDLEFSNAAVNVPIDPALMRP